MQERGRSTGTPRRQTMNPLAEELIVRTAWLAAATSLILGVAAQLHIGPVG